MDKPVVVSIEGKAESLYYLDPNPSGKPVVILLHGLGADSSSWFFQFPSMIAAGMRPIALDLPGFGMSKHISGIWKPSFVVHQIVRLLINLDCNIVDVVGLSMGGTVALTLALDYPQYVNRLVLVNTFANLHPKNLSQYHYLIKRLIITLMNGSTAQAEIVAWRIFPQQDQQQYRQELIQRIFEADPRVYRQAMFSLALFDVRRKLKKISQPTLVISGQNDTTVALENQIDLVRGISGACHVMIPNAGHAVTIDQPERFNQELIHFILE